ncbi:unnamed protein product [Paramecium sonneborni]|uniref:G domain-containing protein n=1 Tax=Paramecium sonneborni TaxID=65129 RepID=A0A8S1PTM4_9CILI|nr:unnamed protein product [Paramecium sonneborni]
MIKERPAVVLISRVGSGKTTLFNKICREAQLTYAGGVSCTRNLFQTSSSYGMGFYIMDTPGFGSDKAVIVHMGGIFAAITGKPLNNILILTKYDRLCNMRKDIAESIKLLSRYREMITVVVTHWDNAENDSQKKQTQKLEEEKKNIVKEVITPLCLQNVIFSGSNTSGEQICKEIDQILIKTIKKKILLTKTEFENQFAEFITLDQNVEINTLDLESEFQAKCNAAINFINQQRDKTSDTAELMHELILAMKEEANATVEEFEKRHGYDCFKLLEQCGNYETAYLTHTKLKSKILTYLNDVINRAQNKMTDYPAHIYNYIKQCPHCQLIWLKVSGCGGQTTCGAFPDSDNEQFKPAAKKFKINISKSQIEIIKLNNNAQANQKQFTNQQKSLKGCGATLIWDSLPILSGQILNELKNAGVLDFFSMKKNGQETQQKAQDMFWDKIQYEAQLQIDRIDNVPITRPDQDTCSTKIITKIIYRNQDGTCYNPNQDLSQIDQINNGQQIILQFNNDERKKNQNQKKSCGGCIIS